MKKILYKRTGSRPHHRTEICRYGIGVLMRVLTKRIQCRLAHFSVVKIQECHYGPVCSFA